MSISEPDISASTLLTPGAVYTREALKKLLSTQDSTINTGVFRPAGFSSVLLFVTRTKTADRTQYEDRLDGATLHWQGQSSGRTDPMIIEHRQRGLELLVFYRERKYEHPKAGFRYLGRYGYVRHSGKHPTSFILGQESSELDRAVIAVERSGDFDPRNIEDARHKTLAAIVRRRGQPAFRRALLAAYNGRCAVTGCKIIEVLEAAHIVPYQGPATNRVSNGLLLRADFHTMFDLGLIAIDEKTRAVMVASMLLSTDYAQWSGKPIYIPHASSDQPDPRALRLHRESAGFYTT